MALQYFVFYFWICLMYVKDEQQFLVSKHIEYYNNFYFEVHLEIVAEVLGGTT